MGDELERLRAAEAQYRSVIAAMAEGVVVQDASGAILECNAAAEQMLGLTRDQMSGRSSLDPRWRAIHEDGSSFPGETHPAMVTLRTGQPCRDVVMGVHKPDGRLTWIAINTQPIAASEATAPHVVCTFRDITAYRQAMQDLQGSEARLQLAMSAARLGTWQWDIAEDRLLWSDTMADVFGLGLGRGRVPAGFDAYLELVHPDDRAEVRAEITAVLQPGAPGDTFHVRHRVGTGKEERWIDGHGRAFRDAQRRVIRMAGVALDVTDVHRLEQRVHQAQRLEAIGRLAGGIAHDFNNVLTVILSASELRLLRGGDATAELEVIRDASTRAAQLTSQLLAFARKRPAGFATIDLGELLEALRPLLARLLGERIALVLDVPAGHGLVHADAGQIEQVLINLVANARDAIGDTGTVRVVLDAAGADELVLAVEDTGAGMPPDVLQRMFEPFFTTKASGTGLGLATSYGIISQHAGRIDVSSTVGKGTRFEIHLPRERDAFARGTAPPPRTTNLPRGDETVLLVEDDPLIRRMSEQILREQGYRVLVAADGLEALELAEHHMGQIALVLTDAVMPRMGGAELAARLHEKWPQLPLLVLSGYEPDDRPSVAALPRLDKPYSSADLLHKIRSVIDRARSA